MEEEMEEERGRRQLRRSADKYSSVVPPPTARLQYLLRQQLPGTLDDMTNLLVVLPDFDVSPFSHILPSLERNLVTTPDLLSLDALDVAKRAQVPPGEVKKLADALIHALRRDISPDLQIAEYNTRDCHGFRSGQHVRKHCSLISTLDDGLDTALGGGIARGHLTELVGER